VTTPGDESLQRAEELLKRLEDARARLEQTDDPNAAVEVLQELSQIAKDVEAEIQRARREADGA
jgi:uncharacterized coiled-coil DUF342 family protein